MRIADVILVMADSFTLTLSGESSVLRTQYFPPIELSPTKTYVLGLIELLTFNAIPNIDVGCNKFYIKPDTTITIPTGSYEIEDIANYLKRAVPKDINISLKANNNELLSEIRCNYSVDFKPKDSIGRLLGFTTKILEGGITHKSELPVRILKVNALRVECNITTGAYINEHRVHTIHQFFPTVPPGYKIVEVPTNVIYHPITVRSIHDIQLRIVDQDGKLINFRGETVTIRLHVKSLR